MIVEEVEELINSQSSKIKFTISLMKSFLSVGNAIYKDSSLKSKVNYREAIIFSCMNGLMDNLWKEPSNYKNLSIEEKELELIKLEKIIKELI